MFNPFRRNRNPVVDAAYRGDLQRTADALVSLVHDSTEEQRAELARRATEFPYCVANVFPGTGVVITDAELTREQADAVCATRAITEAEGYRKIDHVTSFAPVVMLTKDALLLHAEIMREVQERRDRKAAQDAARAVERKPYDERLAERREQDLARLERLAQYEDAAEIRLQKLSMGINPDLDGSEVGDTAEDAEDAA